MAYYLSNDKKRLRVRFNIAIRRYYEFDKTKHIYTGYTIIDDTICIHPYVRDNLEQLYHSMQYITKIVFYSKIDFTSSLFNQTFLPSPNIKQIVFASGFNSPFVLTPFITHLAFGDNFNQPIILNSSIVYVQFDSKFKQSFNTNKKLIVLLFDCFHLPTLKLNKCLKILETYDRFGQNVMCKLSKNLKYLKINTNEHIDLPKHLIYLNISLGFAKPIKLTPNIRFLMIERQFDRQIIMDYINKDLCLYFYTFNPLINDNLPNNAKHITLQTLKMYDKSLDNLPNNTDIYTTTEHCDKLGIKISICDHFLYVF